MQWELSLNKIKSNIYSSKIQGYECIDDMTENPTNCSLIWVLVVLGPFLVRVCYSSWL